MSKNSFNNSYYSAKDVRGTAVINNAYLDGLIVINTDLTCRTNANFSIGTIGNGLLGLTSVNIEVNNLSAGNVNANTITIATANIFQANLLNTSSGNFHGTNNTLENVNITFSTIGNALISTGNINWANITTANINLANISVSNVINEYLTFGSFGNTFTSFGNTAIATIGNLVVHTIGNNVSTIETGVLISTSNLVETIVLNPQGYTDLPAFQTFNTNLVSAYLAQNTQNLHVNGVIANNNLLELVQGPGIQVQFSTGNLTVGNMWVKNDAYIQGTLFTVNATETNVLITNESISNAVITSASIANLYVSQGNLTLSTIGSLQLNSTANINIGNFTSANILNATIPNLVSTNASIANLINTDFTMGSGVIAGSPIYIGSTVSNLSEYAIWTVSSGSTLVSLLENSSSVGNITLMQNNGTTGIVAITTSNALSLFTGELVNLSSTFLIGIHSVYSTTSNFSFSVSSSSLGISNVGTAVIIKQSAINLTVGNYTFSQYDSLIGNALTSISQVGNIYTNTQNFLGNLNEITATGSALPFGFSTNGSYASSCYYTMGIDPSELNFAVANQFDSLYDHSWYFSTFTTSGSTIIGGPVNSVIFESDFTTFASTGVVSFDSLELNLNATVVTGDSGDWNLAAGSFQIEAVNITLITPAFNLSGALATIESAQVFVTGAEYTNSAAFWEFIGGTFNVAAVALITLTSPTTISLEAATSIILTSAGIINLISSVGNFNCTGVLNLASGAAMSIEAGAAVNLAAGAGMSIEAGGAINIAAGAVLSIEGAIDVNLSGGAIVTIEAVGDLFLAGGGAFELSAIAAGAITVGDALNISALTPVVGIIAMESAASFGIIAGNALEINVVVGDCSIGIEVGNVNLYTVLGSMNICAAVGNINIAGVDPEGLLAVVGALSCLIWANTINLNGSIRLNQNVINPLELDFGYTEIIGSNNYMTIGSLRISDVGTDITKPYCGLLVTPLLYVASGATIGNLRGGSATIGNLRGVDAFSYISTGTCYIDRGTIGNFAATNSTISNLCGSDAFSYISTGTCFIDQGTIGNFAATNNVISNSTISNLCGSDAFSYISTGTCFIDKGTIGNFAATKSTISHLLVTNGTISNMNVIFNATVGSLNVENGITTGNIFGTSNYFINGSIGNLNSDSITVSNLHSTNISNSNVIITKKLNIPLALGSDANIGVSFLNQATITTGTILFTNITNEVVTNSTISNLRGSGAFSYISTGTCYINQGTIGNFGATNISAAKETVGTLIVSGNIGSVIQLNTGTSGEQSIQYVNLTGGWSVGLAVAGDTNNFDFYSGGANRIAFTPTGSAYFSGSIGSTAISTGQLNVTNSSITNLVVTNLSTGNITLPTNITFGNLKATNISTSTLFTTNITATNAVFTNISAGNIILPTNATFSNLKTTNIVNSGGNIQLWNPGNSETSIQYVNSTFNWSVGLAVDGDTSGDFNFYSNGGNKITFTNTGIGYFNNVSSNSLNTNIATIGTLNVSGIISSGNVYSSFGSFYNIASTNLIVDNISTANIVNNNAITTNNLLANTAITTNNLFVNTTISAPNINSTFLSVGNLNVVGSADLINLKASSGYGTNIIFDSVSITGNRWNVFASGSGAGEGNNRFIIQDQTGSWNPICIMNSGGNKNVGINTVNPSKTLDVNGSFRADSVSSGNMCMSGYIFYPSAGIAAYQLPTITTFTSSNFGFTWPANSIYSEVLVIGNGGAGGPANLTNGGPGGGSGAWSKAIIRNTGVTYNIQVGGVGTNGSYFYNSVTNEYIISGHGTGATSINDPGHGGQPQHIGGSAFTCVELGYGAGGFLGDGIYGGLGGISKWGTSEAQNSYNGLIAYGNGGYGGIVVSGNGINGYSGIIVAKFFYA